VAIAFAPEGAGRAATFGVGAMHHRPQQGVGPLPGGEGGAKRRVRGYGGAGFVTTVATARKLRRNQTDAELKLWLHLRNRRLDGLKFRRQVRIAGFVADFLCEDAKLIVEVDGGQHAESERDLARSKVLQAAGFEVLRFWNNDVWENVEGVLEPIREMARLLRAEVTEARR
jgi:very-short-patch-repair endonuclease